MEQYEITISNYCCYISIAGIIYRTNNLQGNLKSCDYEIRSVYRDIVSWIIENIKKKKKKGKKIKI